MTRYRSYSSLYYNVPVNVDIIPSGTTAQVSGQLESLRYLREGGAHLYYEMKGNPNHAGWGHLENAKDFDNGFHILPAGRLPKGPGM